MMIKSSNLLSPNKAGKILSGTLPVFDLNSKHPLSIFCLWGMTNPFKSPPWIPHDTQSFAASLLLRAASPASQAAFQVIPSGIEFSVGSCKSTAGPKANRNLFCSQGDHSPGYTGLSLIKRKEARFFLSHAGLWKPSVSRAKAKAADSTNTPKQFTV